MQARHGAGKGETRLAPGSLRGSSESESRGHLQDQRKEYSPEGALRNPIRDPRDSLMA